MTQSGVIDWKNVVEQWASALVIVFVIMVNGLHSSLRFSTFTDKVLYNCL